jgi:hypothetical protein
MERVKGYFERISEGHDMYPSWDQLAEHIYEELT